MLYYTSKKFTYDELMLILAERCKDGVLQDVRVLNCLVTGVPKDAPLIEYKGREVSHFFGFPCKDVHVAGCHFEAQK